MGIELFKTNLTALQIALSKKSKENIALHYYHSPARGLFFKLEALCRMYRNLHNKKLFNSLYDEFKLMEDGLGKMDYYGAFLKEFSIEKKAPVSFLNYFINHFEHESDNFQLLIKSFPFHDTKYSSQLELRLADADWIKDTAEERKQIIIFLIDCIDKIEDDYSSGKLHFNSVEEGLHEFRRKLRWLSIYVSSVDGLVQLKKIKHAAEDLKRYLTVEIVKLPYNQMPPIKRGLKPIHIEAPNFYALSWLIQELGVLKDMGLKSHVVDEATSKLKQIKDIHAVRKTLKQNIKYSPNEILELAQHHTDDFIHKHFVLARIKRDLRRALNESY